MKASTSLPHSLARREPMNARQTRYAGLRSSLALAALVASIVAGGLTLGADDAVAMSLTYGTYDAGAGQWAIDWIARCNAYGL
jgi:hypothetical protein